MERGVIFVVALLTIAAQYVGLFEHLQRVGFAGRWNDLGIVLLGVGAIATAAWMRLGEWRRSNAFMAGVWKLYVVLLLGLGVGGLGVLLSDARLVWMGCGWIFALGIGALLGFGAGAMLRMGLLIGLVPLLPWAWEWRVHLYGQAWSSWFAGVMLDFARVFFYWRGNVIGLVDHDVLGNAQASGIRWFSPVLLTVLGYGFAVRHGWFRTLYLVFQTVFWIVIVQGVSIAYSLWKLNAGGGQSDLVWGGWLDGVGIVIVLFLVWSSDQFYSAFTYREVDELPSDTKGSGRGVAPVVSSAGALWGLVIGMLCFGAIGGWGWYTERWKPVLGWRESGVGIEAQTWKGWGVTEEDVTEGFEPVFAQGASWVQRQWRVERGRDDLGSEGRKEAQEDVRVRVVGPWYFPPVATWLWDWYGWKIGELKRDGDLVSWTMSRTIAEEGFVVSRWESQGEQGMKVQWVMEVRAVRPVSKERQEEYIAWFKELRESERVGGSGE